MIATQGGQKTGVTLLQNKEKFLPLSYMQL